MRGDKSNVNSQFCSEIAWNMNAGISNLPMYNTAHRAYFTLPNGVLLGRIELAGVWEYSGNRYCYIAQAGRQLVLENERGGSRATQ